MALQLMKMWRWLALQKKPNVNLTMIKGLIVTLIVTLKSQFMYEIIHDFAQQGIQCPILTFWANMEPYWGLQVMYKWYGDHQNA